MLSHIDAAIATTYRIPQTRAEGRTYFRDRCLQPLGHPSKYYGAQNLGGSLPTPQPVSAPRFLGRPLIPRDHSETSVRRSRNVRSWTCSCRALQTVGSSCSKTTNRSSTNLYPGMRTAPHVGYATNSGPHELHARHSRAVLVRRYTSAANSSRVTNSTPYVARNHVRLIASKIEGLPALTPLSSEHRYEFVYAKCAATVSLSAHSATAF